MTRYDPARIRVGHTRRYRLHWLGVDVLAWHPAVAPDRPLYRHLLCRT